MSVGTDSNAARLQMSSWRRSGRCCAAVTLGALAIAIHVQAEPPARAGWLLRSLDASAGPRESRRDILDSAMLPGSLMKAVALVAALEAGAIGPDTTRLCRRVSTHRGYRYACSHVDLRRPLGPAEALAHSCNDYFLQISPRLSRTAFNDVRARAGLPPIGAEVDVSRALLGLAGPRVTPRALLDAFSRLVGTPGTPGVSMGDATRRVLIEGLRGAAVYGSASELGQRSIRALAKTGTTAMPGGGAIGLVIVFAPADRPLQALIVVAPGAAGRDATSIAADMLAAEAGLRVGTTDPAGRRRVEVVALEAYVARVVAGEADPAAPAAARQALAIAARTYALAHRGRHQREGYDLCDTTHCQVVAPATPAALEAAAATAGRILVDGDRPATTFYSASCGGRTEVPAAVWPGASSSGSPESGRDDEPCRDVPGWTSEIVVEDIERALRLSGRRGSRLGALRIAQRTGSGRVAWMRAEGFLPADLSGEEFRLAVGRALGWQRLKSTAFQVRRTARGYAFDGRGSGHGVGMCLLGAARRAAAGATADEVLRFYYPGLRIDTSHSMAPRADSAADVLVRLPALEETDRSLLVSLVRSARDDIAARANVAPPVAIRVTVHPSVDNFGRAAGQPWWVAGATRDRDIALLPLSILKRRGQLERTLRHEVAHAVLDEHLLHRPLWVREAAALYFGGSADGSAPRDDACPTDAELRSPASVAALQSAYARAEACFRRQLAAGRGWREVQ